MYGPQMVDFIYRELEIGYRAATFEDNEACGFGTIFDLQYLEYCREKGWVA